MRKVLLVIGGAIVLGGGVWYVSQQGMDESGAGAAGGVAFDIDADDIGGIVMGPNGPEAGVWVIAETDDLPTKFVRSVVTDDAGQYVIPDLPDANYMVWSRGYGLLDSAKTETTPGSQIEIETIAAPDERTAAQIYPALYWKALIEIPAADEFPGTGDAGNGINPDIHDQAQWVNLVQTSGCGSCHQFGTKATRELLPELGQYENSVNAWTRRIQSGQASGSMVNGVARFGAQRALQEYASWTDRIAAGELPFEKPERPQGIERNVVVTQWDWSEPTYYLHDEIATDRRNPTVNAYGKLYGATEQSTDQIPILDPISHEASFTNLPVADPAMPSARTTPMFQPSPYWGDEPIWESSTNTHNPMMDHLGRVWMTARAKVRENPNFCREGSDHPAAQLTPIDESGRDLALYDPTTEDWTLIPTCFGTHHLAFTEDDTHTLWFSGGGSVIGWFNTTMWEETGDIEASQGWTAFVLDTNGNGMRDPDPVGPDEPVDPTRDKIIDVGNYSDRLSF